MCTVLTPDEIDRDALKAHLINNGIETRPMFYPIHTMPIYSKGYERHPIAEKLGSRGINLPSYPGLNEKDIQIIVNALINFS